MLTRQQTEAVLRFNAVCVDSKHYKQNFTLPMVFLMLIICVNQALQLRLIVRGQLTFTLVNVRDVKISGELTSVIP